MSGSTTKAGKLTFDAVFQRLTGFGPALVVSSKGTPYTVTAKRARNGDLVIVAEPRSGEVRIHEDCWGDDITCQGTRAGGVYNGSPSLFDWFASSFH